MRSLSSFLLGLFVMLLGCSGKEGPRGTAGSEKPSATGSSLACIRGVIRSEADVRWPLFVTALGDSANDDATVQLKRPGEFCVEVRRSEAPGEDLDGDGTTGQALTTQLVLSTAQLTVLPSEPERILGTDAFWPPRRQPQDDLFWPRQPDIQVPARPGECSRTESCADIGVVGVFSLDLLFSGGAEDPR